MQKKRCPPQMVAVFLLLAGAWTAHAEVEAVRNPRTILDMVATNTLTHVPPPTLRHPTALALEAIIADTPAHEHAWTAGADRHITRLGEHLVIDPNRIEERIALSRTERVLREVDRIVRDRMINEAIDLLEDTLASAVHEEVQFILHFRLGTLLFREQRYERAAHHMAQALNYQPFNAGLASNLAAAQMTIGQLDDALFTLNSIRMSLVTSPQLLFSINFNKACLYSLKGRHEEAIEHLIEAVQNDPASTFASLGDPQLDPIRNDLRFLDVQLTLDRFLGRSR